MLKAVIDTIVILSGSVATSGSPYEVLEAWRRRDFILVVREDIICEVVEVLRRPYYRDKRHVTDSIIAEIADALRNRALLTSGNLMVDVITADPDDNMFVACAVEGDADYIVSGDHHLLELGTYTGISIVSPAAFLEILREAG